MVKCGVFYLNRHSMFALVLSFWAYKIPWENCAKSAKNPCRLRHNLMSYRGRINFPTKIIEMTPTASKILRIELFVLPIRAYAQDDKVGANIANSTVVSSRCRGCNANIKELSRSDWGIVLKYRGFLQPFRHAPRVIFPYTGSFNVIAL